jgi:hypothetical protein
LSRCCNKPQLTNETAGLLCLNESAEIIAASSPPTRSSPASALIPPDCTIMGPGIMTLKLGGLSARTRLCRTRPTHRR